jgi:hypothetical protein
MMSYPQNVAPRVMPWIAACRAVRALQPSERRGFWRRLFGK